ncbi:hypothetical protein, partial [Hyphomonas sp.]
MSFLRERMQERLSDTPAKDRRSLLVKVIECRAEIWQFRHRELSVEEIAEILAEEGLHISPRTLSNYIGDIGKAEKALADAGNANPTDAEIRAEIWRKPTKSTPRPKPRSPLPTARPFLGAPGSIISHATTSRKS